MTAVTVEGDGGDRIQLRGLRAIGTHGVLPEEQSRAQPFEIDLDLTVDLAPAGPERPAGRHRRLRRRRRDAPPESSPGRPPSNCSRPWPVPWPTPRLARDRRIAAVTVHLRKLQPPLAMDIATVGVRITRRQ